jgi:hypothetical protein
LVVGKKTVSFCALLRKQKKKSFFHDSFYLFFDPFQSNGHPLGVFGPFKRIVGFSEDSLNVLHLTGGVRITPCINVECYY